MRAFFDSLICDRPIRVRARAVRELDADGRLVNVLISRVPGSISVPHELADLACRGDLIVGRRCPGLPDLLDLVDGQDPGVVVDDHLVDLLPAAPWREMFVKELDAIWF